MEGKILKENSTAILTFRSQWNTKDVSRFFCGMTGDLPARYLINPHKVIRYKIRKKGLVITVKNPTL